MLLARRRAPLDQALLARAHWVNAAWLLWLGLTRLGYASMPTSWHADHGTVCAGPREYYDPYTGRGMGAVDFAWSTLVNGDARGGFRGRRRAT